MNVYKKGSLIMIDFTSNNVTFYEKKNHFQNNYLFS